MYKIILYGSSDKSEYLNELSDIIKAKINEFEENGTLTKNLFAVSTEIKDGTRLQYALYYLFKVFREDLQEKLTTPAITKYAEEILLDAFRYTSDYSGINGVTNYPAYIVKTMKAKIDDEDGEKELAVKYPKLTVANIPNLSSVRDKLIEDGSIVLSDEDPDIVTYVFSEFDTCMVGIFNLLSKEIARLDEIDRNCCNTEMRMNCVQKTKILKGIEEDMLELFHISLTENAHRAFSSIKEDINE